MRNAFIMPEKNKIQWFPGHMKKGVEQIQAALHNIDGVLEVHDARIPFSGRNNQLRDIIHVRPHVLLLNKSDLADLSRKGEIETKLTEQGIANVQFISCGGKDILKVMKNVVTPILLREVQARPRFRPDVHNHYNIMVIGVPNVGKSTILNKLRQASTTNRKAAPVGAMPGVTRAVMNKVRVNFDPDMFVVDTPGILSPKIGNVDTGLRLTLCECIPSPRVGEDTMVDYLLFKLNKSQLFQYVKHYGLSEPTDDVLKLLSHIALKHKLVMKSNEISMTGGNRYRVDFVAASRIVLKDFQQGTLGLVMFDDDYL
ncbi:hypothetical protein DPMN_018847 [Dreissena polymorpha]|uniref:Mitochondrial GTPase 1 n=2 Tax=Dreissena polymorpha TaxID=45954 RepID=A0A9D4NJY5_DREPO|nr:hypothetical protein DPMN_018784 [Dreissena polymorpha]KAH3894690.1 hypothetical protein DPMN_018847 [Dreissena polymorpha]